MYPPIPGICLIPLNTLSPLCSLLHPTLATLAQVLPAAPILCPCSPHFAPAPVLHACTPHSPSPLGGSPHHPTRDRFPRCPSSPLRPHRVDHTPCVDPRPRSLGFTIHHLVCDLPVPPLLGDTSHHFCDFSKSPRTPLCSSSPPLSSHLISLSSQPVVAAPTPSLSSLDPLFPHELVVACLPISPEAPSFTPVSPEPSLAPLCSRTSP